MNALGDNISRNQFLIQGDISYEIENTLISEVSVEPTPALPLPPVENDEENGAHNANGKIKWTEAMTQLLFVQYETWNTKITMKKKMYEKIAEHFKSKGYDLTSENVEIKWKTLLRAFKKAKSAANRSGAGSINFKYYE